MVLNIKVFNSKSFENIFDKRIQDGIKLALWCVINGVHAIGPPNVAKEYLYQKKG